MILTSATSIKIVSTCCITTSLLCSVPLIILAVFEAAVLFKDNMPWVFWCFLCMYVGGMVSYHENFMCFSGLAIKNTVLSTSCSYPQNTESSPSPPYTKNITFIWQYTSTVPNKGNQKLNLCQNCIFFIAVFKFQQEYRDEKYFARPGGLTGRPERDQSEG